jgi:elongation factor 1-alpha
MSGKPLVNLVFIGHVDHGKSTLVGRTLFESGVVSETVMKRLEEESAKMGKEHAKFAWVMDRLKDERESDQTTDISYKFFETRSRGFTIIDAPGHRDFVKNMITGSSQADAAVLVVSAAPGQFEAGMKSSAIEKGEIGGQTREHAALAFTLGIKQVIVAVNKMDTVDYSQRRYDEIKQSISSMLSKVGFSGVERFLFIPIAAYYGENISKHSTKMGWYSGPTLLEALDTLQEAEKPVDIPLRIPVQRTFNVPGIGLLPVGRVETGIIKVGDDVTISPSGAQGRVKSMEIFHKALEKALPGDNIGISIKGLKKEDVWKGCVIGSVDNPPTVTRKFKGKIVVTEHPVGIRPGYRPVLFCHTEQAECCIEELVNKVDAKTGEVIVDHPDLLAKGDAGIVLISTEEPIVIEKVSYIPRLSRFAIRDMGTTVAVGICTDIL